MMSPSSSVTLVSAVLGAGAYIEDGPPPTPESPGIAKLREMRRSKALGNIRLAQVDLFCDHTDHAVAEIRAAQADLASVGLDSDHGTAETLERAAWLARHNQYLEANAALESARAGISRAS
ncbi:MAG: hypothetical protein RJA44_1022 [Pseudomonadota bacterium]|jgi:hypothetical protein